MTVGGCVARALVLGGGFSGMTAALELDRAGIAVDLVEIDPAWRISGAGISMHGAALRVLSRLGLLDRFLEVGAVADGFDLRSPTNDAILASLTAPAMDGSVPSSAGVMRPALAEVLREAVRSAGIAVRLGTTFVGIERGPDAERVSFTDGSVGLYDLVVGADGLSSATRRAVFPDVGQPEFVGQAVWRAVLPTPDDLPRGAMWPGPGIKVGLNPVSRTHSYLFLTQNRETTAHVDPEGGWREVAGLLEGFASPILGRVRAELGPHSQALYRPLWQFLMPRPWFRGRVVLIGDAVHATTPHLAAGACIGMEDAVVLAEEVAAARALPEGLAAFEARRFARCRMVVETSGEICRIERTGGDKQVHARLMRDAMAALAEPI